jgi:hypothetical protein
MHRIELQEIDNIHLQDEISTLKKEKKEKDEIIRT